MYWKRILSLVFAFCFVFSLVNGQSRSALESQRNQLRKEIEQTQQLLNETKKTAKVSLGQLALISRKVNLQEGVVDNIHKEIRNLSDNIYLSQLEINRMNRVLDTLKLEYAKSMVYAYKSRGNYSFLNFIFASQNFNDAIKRIAYLKSYRNYRENQAKNILMTQALLKTKVAELEDSKKRKGVVLNEESQEMGNLVKQRSEKAQIVNGLKGRQRELNAIIKEKRSRDAKLKNAIAAMVRREIEMARAEAARKERARLEAMKKENSKPETAASNSRSAPASSSSEKRSSVPANSVLVTTEADATLNANFKKNKGRLPWPANGYLLYHFGNNELPGGVVYNNAGVSIGTKLGEPVKAVFEGEVTLVSYVEDNQAVFVKHGRYFTVYGNLTNVTVKRGDQVQIGQVIGRAGENDEGEGGRVEFLLLRENDYLNPQAWLK